MKKISPTTNRSTPIETSGELITPGAKYQHPEDGIVTVVGITNGRVIYTTQDDMDYDMDLGVFRTLKKAN